LFFLNISTKDQNKEIRFIDLKPLFLKILNLSRNQITRIKNLIPLFGIFNKSYFSSKNNRTTYCYYYLNGLFMRTLLIFAPYLLVPFILTLIFKKYKIKSTEWTYILTGLLILIYPFVTFWFDGLLNPPIHGPKCGNSQIGFLLANILLFLPISFIIQLVFNKIFLKKKIKS